MNALVPAPYQVTERRPETVDTVTLTLAPLAEPLPAFAPGQFAMLAALGVGEVPISVSGVPATRGGPLVHTLRSVGAVTAALHAARPGDVFGVRGPFGSAWDVETAAGQDLLVVAGGIGLAPLRPVLRAALADRDRYRRITLLVGARTPQDLLFTGELRALGERDDVTVEVTVDRAGASWGGHVGVVTSLLGGAVADAARTVAFVCGPELMMRLTADALVKRGVPAGAVRVSLERNMRCGVALCGHCQFGPLLVCRDGPVATYDRVATLLTVREL
jgi:anaerobic sulfite reductase subunit B